MKSDDHLNKIGIMLLTYERHQYFKKQSKKQRHEKAIKQSKHSNLVRLICSK